MLGTGCTSTTPTFPQLATAQRTNPKNINRLRTRFAMSNAPFTPINGQHPSTAVSANYGQRHLTSMDDRGQPYSLAGHRVAADGGRLDAATKLAVLRRCVGKKAHQLTNASHAVKLLNTTAPNLSWWIAQGPVFTGSVGDEGTATPLSRSTRALWKAGTSEAPRKIGSSSVKGSSPQPGITRVKATLFTSS